MALTVADVSEHALIMRINRALHASDQQLRKARGAHELCELGTYYLIDLNGNFVLETHVQVEALARRLGVLESWENVAP